MEEKLSPLAKDLLFTMVYHKDLKYEDIPEIYKTEYNEWYIKYHELNGE